MHILMYILISIGTYLYTYVHTHVVPGLSSDPPRHTEYRWERGKWRQEGNYAKSKLQKTASFVEVRPLNP